MSKKFTVKWEAEDGYTGGSRPQIFHLSVFDFGDVSEMTDAQIENLLDEAIQDDFDQKVTWYSANRDEAIAWIKANCRGGE
jgi:hypothetical protein